MQKRRKKGQRDFDGCPCSGKNLSKLVQPSILAIVRSGPAHGYAITRRIAEQYTFPPGAPKHSGIYRLLRRMEADGLLKSHLEDAKAGPARRVYSIAPEGEACLRRWIESLSRYKQAIESFLELGKRRK